MEYYEFQHLADSIVDDLRLRYEIDNYMDCHRVDLSVVIYYRKITIWIGIEKENQYSLTVYNPKGSPEHGLSYHQLINQLDLYLPLRLQLKLFF